MRNTECVVSLYKCIYYILTLLLHKALVEKVLEFKLDGSTTTAYLFTEIAATLDGPNYISHCSVNITSRTLLTLSTLRRSTSGAILEYIGKHQVDATFPKVQS